MARGHQTVFVELPVLVAVRAEPVTRIVVPFVGEAHGDPILLKRPELLDQSVVELTVPLAPQKGDDLLSADDELGSIAPAALRVVGERHPYGISGVPSILGQSDLLDGGF